MEEKAPLAVVGNHIVASIKDNDGAERLLRAGVVIDIVPSKLGEGRMVYICKPSPTDVQYGTRSTIRIPAGTVIQVR